MLEEALDAVKKYDEKILKFLMDGESVDIPN
jgi:hypothetical protein